MRFTVFVLWMMATIVPIGYLMAKHLAPLPADHAPQVGSTWRATAQGEWQAIHVLATDCVCSGAVAAHLESRGAFRGLRERVWLIGRNTALAARLTARGFDVESTGAEAVERLSGIDGVPWLVFVSPRNRVAYAGGYLGETQQAGGYLDTAIWLDVQQGRSPTSQPVFGCPTSQALKRTRDPLQLKALALVDGR